MPLQSSLNHNIARPVGGFHSVENRTATAIVPDFQLSLAIGKEGQNARLAARLTGYHIDIHSDTESGEEGLASRSSVPDDVIIRSQQQGEESETLS